MKQGDWDILSDMTVTGQVRPESWEKKAKLPKATTSFMPVRNRARAVKLVNNSALALSTFYTIIFALVRLDTLALYNFVFCCFYGSFIVVAMLQAYIVT